MTRTLYSRLKWTLSASAAIGSSLSAAGYHTVNPALSHSPAQARRKKTLWAAGLQTVANYCRGCCVRDPNVAGDGELTRYRRLDVGFVFRFYNLTPSLTARDNVAIVTEIVRDPMTPQEAPRGWWALARGWITCRPSSPDS